MIHMRDFHDNSLDSVLAKIPECAVQGVVMGSASITIIASSGVETFEIGSLGEVQIETDDGIIKDIFIMPIDEISKMIDSKISRIFVHNGRCLLKIDTPSWNVIFTPGVDFIIEIAQIVRTKGPSFFIG